MTEVSASTQLDRMVASTTPPVLSVGELADLLVLAERLDSSGLLASSETEWAATTVHALGDVRVPTLRTGHRYQVTAAGTSGATQPTWPLILGSTVVDGTVTWTNIAGAWLPTYDLAAAAAEGWRWKAAKLSDRFAFGHDGARYDRQQAFEHAIKMAEHYDGQVGVYAGAADGSGTITLPQSGTHVVNDPDYGIRLRRWDGSGRVPSINVEP